MSNKEEIKYNGYFPEIPKLTTKALARACRVKPEKRDILFLFNCHSDTLEQFCKANSFLSFEHFRVVHSANAKDMLMQKAIDMAMEGDRVAMRLCLINLCGWSDSVDQKIGKITGDIEKLDIKQVKERLLAVASLIKIEGGNNES